MLSKLKEYAMGVNIKFFLEKNHYIQSFDKVPIRYIVTYADNMAVEFFKKQGFEPVKYSRKDKWNQRIKISKQSLQLEQQNLFGPDWHKFKDRIEIYKHATLMCYTFQNEAIGDEFKNIIGKKLL